MEVDWSAIKRGRSSLHGAFPRVLKVPMIEDAEKALYDMIPDGGSVLDIGAYDRNIERYLKNKPKKVYYKSFDVDKSLPHDYYSFDEIDERFDVAVSFEVIEHLGVKDAVGLVSNMYSVLKDGGKAVISTPNIFHPTVFWRDCTHRTGFRYQELAGIMAASGFRNIKIYRVMKLSLKNRITIFFYKPVLKLLDMDYAGRILAIGER